MGGDGVVYGAQGLYVSVGVVRRKRCVHWLVVHSLGDCGI